MSADARVVAAMLRVGTATTRVTVVDGTGARRGVASVRVVLPAAAGDSAEPAAT